MGKTIEELVRQQDGRKCIVRRDTWKDGDYAVVHQVAGSGEHSEAFGFVCHKGSLPVAGSIKAAWTPSWDVIHTLSDAVGRGQYHDIQGRMERLLFIVKRYQARSIRELERILDVWREYDSSVLELYDCLRMRPCRKSLQAAMRECADREKADRTVAVCMPQVCAVM